MRAPNSDSKASLYDRFRADEESATQWAEIQDGKRTVFLEYLAKQEDAVRSEKSRAVEHRKDPVPVQKRRRRRPRKSRATDDPAEGGEASGGAHSRMDGAPLGALRATRAAPSGRDLLARGTPQSGHRGGSGTPRGARDSFRATSALPDPDAAPVEAEGAKSKRGAAAGADGGAGDGKAKAQARAAAKAEHRQVQRERLARHWQRGAAGASAPVPVAERVKRQHRPACGLCHMRFAAEDLVTPVSRRAIVQLRQAWASEAEARRRRPPTSADGESRMSAVEAFMRPRARTGKKRSSVADVARHAVRSAKMLAAADTIAEQAAGSGAGDADAGTAPAGGAAAGRDQGRHAGGRVANDPRSLTLQEREALKLQANRLDATRFRLGLQYDAVRCCRFCGQFFARDGDGARRDDGSSRDDTAARPADPDRVRGGGRGSSSHLGVRAAAAPPRRHGRSAPGDGAAALPTVTIRSAEAGTRGGRRDPSAVSARSDRPPRHGAVPPPAVATERSAPAPDSAFTPRGGALRPAPVPSLDLRAASARSGDATTAAASAASARADTAASGGGTDRRDRRLPHPPPQRDEPSTARARLQRPVAHPPSARGPHTRAFAQRMETTVIAPPDPASARQDFAQLVGENADAMQWYREQSRRGSDDRFGAGDAAAITDYADMARNLAAFHTHAQLAGDGLATQRESASMLPPASGAADVTVGASRSNARRRDTMEFLAKSLAPVAPPPAARRASRPRQPPHARRRRRARPSRTSAVSLSDPDVDFATADAVAQRRLARLMPAQEAAAIAAAAARPHTLSPIVAGPMPGWAAASNGFLVPVSYDGGPGGDWSPRADDGWDAAPSVRASLAPYDPANRVGAAHRLTSPREDAAEGWARPHVVRNPTHISLPKRSDKYAYLAVNPGSASASAVTRRPSDTVARDLLRRNRHMAFVPVRKGAMR